LQIIHKAYVYLTCGNHLLVFSEPDHPEIGLQVPGGTIDPGESYLIGARREFFEETGLNPAFALTPFFQEDYITKGEVDLEGELRQMAGCHRRCMFHAVIANRPKEAWEHFEMTPSIGGDPIRFHLFWIDLFSSECQEPGTFYAGFDAPLAELRKHIAGSLS